MHFKIKEHNQTHSKKLKSYLLIFRNNSYNSASKIKLTYLALICFEKCTENLSCDSCIFFETLFARLTVDQSVDKIKVKTSI